MSIVEIPLTKGKVALIDAADFDLVSRYKWRAFCSRGNWYAQTDLSRSGGRRKTVFMHRLLLGVDGNYKVDHRDGDGLNNRRKNIRCATEAQNQMNRKARYGASRFKGVSYNAHTRMWLARIVYSQQTACLGHYVTDAMAGLAYDLAAERLFRTFANLNHPRDARSRLAIVRNEALAKLRQLQLLED